MILITGGTGLSGSYVIPELQRRTLPVRACEGVTACTFFSSLDVYGLSSAPLIRVETPLDDTDDDLRPRQGGKRRVAGRPEPHGLHQSARAPHLQKN